MRKSAGRGKGTMTNCGYVMDRRQNERVDSQKETHCYEIMVKGRENGQRFLIIPNERSA